MASTSVASRLARRTIFDDLRPILVGLGDNIFQTPKPRRRRSPPVHPPPYVISDGGVPGIIFRNPALLPVLVISPEHIRFVIGPGAVIDRIHGWEYVSFDRRVGADPFDWRIFLVFLAAAGATAFVFYLTKPRRDDGPGGPGADASGPRGPGPGGPSRFRRSLGVLEALAVGGGGGGGDAGGGRFRRSLGLLEVLGGGGGGGGVVEGCSGGGGGTGPQDRESSAELQHSTVGGVVARYSHEFPKESEAYSSETCDWIELFLLTECISQANWVNSMRLMHSLEDRESSAELQHSVAGGVEGCSSGCRDIGPQDPESSAELQDSTVDGVLARYSHEFHQESEAYSSQRCDWLDLFLLAECISQCIWESSMRLMHSLDFPEGDSSEICLKTVDDVLARYSHEFHQESEAYSNQRCDWIEIFLLTEYISQCIWESSMRLMHSLDFPEGDSSEVAGGVEACSGGGHGISPQDPESSAKLQDSVLSACDISVKERAGGRLLPPNVQVCRG